MAITLSREQGFPEQLRQSIQMGHYNAVPDLPPPSGTLEPWRGYGAYRGFAEADAAPSRALWFVLGAVTVLVGPALLNVVMAGGDRAARKIRG